MRCCPAVLVALACAAPAGAAPPWSGPAGITESNRSASGAEVLTTGDGSTVVFYRREGGGIPGGVCSFVTRAPGAAAFGSPHLLHSGCAGAVTYAKRSVAAMTLTSTARGDTYSIAFGSAKGSYGRARKLVAGQGIRSVQLAGNADGVLAVAWFEDRGTANDRVYLRIRPRGGRFGAPIRLAQDVVRSVAVAVGSRGDVLVAYDARGTIKARLRTAGRRSFTRTESIRSQDAYFASIKAAVTANGRAILGWSAQFLSEGGDRGPRFNQVAVRPAGAALFREAQLLERDEVGNIDLGDLQLVAEPGGPAFVAWTGREGEHDVVRVSEADSRGAFRPWVPVSPADQDSYVTAAARGALGDAAVLWMRHFDAPSAAFAAYKLAGTASFGPPERISTGADGRFGRVAFDPFSGRATAVWEDIFGVGDDRVRRVFAATRARP